MLARPVCRALPACRVEEPSYSHSSEQRQTCCQFWRRICTPKKQSTCPWHYPGALLSPKSTFWLCSRSPTLQLMPLFIGISLVGNLSVVSTAERWSFAPGFIKVMIDFKARFFFFSLLQLLKAKLALRALNSHFYVFEKLWNLYFCLWYIGTMANRNSQSQIPQLCALWRNLNSPTASFQMLIVCHSVMWSVFNDNMAWRWVTFNRKKWWSGLIVL